jgi:vitamin B12 transporter
MNGATRCTLVRVPLLAWCLAPSIAGAQAGMDTVTLSPVVVTATLVPMRVDEVAASVTVLSGDALRARGLRTVAEALRNIPGVTVVATGSFGGQTSLFLRGGESDYVKVLIDGVPQNQPGGFFDFANLGIEDVDRIEIVRGPASVLYGSDAVTGVIQVFTRSGRAGLAGQLSIGGGTYGTHWGTVDLDGATGVWSYGLSVSRHETAGIYSVNNRYHRDLASGRAQFRPDARTVFALTARWSDAVFHFPTDFTGQVADSNQYTSARGPSIALEAARTVSSHVAAHLLIGSHFERDGFDNSADGLADTTAACCYHSRDDIRRIVGRGWVDLRLPAWATITAGAELEGQRQRGTTLSASRDNGAAFAQLLGHLTTAGVLTLGARLDENQEFGSHATGRAGLSWRLASSTRLRGSVGTSFKEPSFYENFATGFVRGNPELHPEQSASREIAIEQGVAGRRLTAAITYFSQCFRDLIQYSAAPMGPDSVNYANVAAATARGVEVSMGAGLGDGVSLSGSFNSTWTRDATTGQPLLRRPINSGTVLLAWSRWWGEVTLSGVFTGARSDLDYRTGVPASVTLPAYTRVDASLEYRFSTMRGASPGLLATVRIENALDARFQQAVGFPSPGRTVLLGAEMSLGR